MTRRLAVLPLLAAIPLAIAGCGGSSPVGATLLAAHPSNTLSQPEKTQIIRGIDTFVADTHDVGRAAADATNEAAVLTRLAGQHQGRALAGNLRDAGSAWTALAKAIASKNANAIVAAVSRVRAADGKLALVPSTSTSTSTSSGSSSRQAADAAAEELVHTAQVVIETYATDHSGSYAGATAAVLHGYESFVQVGPGNGHAFLAARDGVKTTATSYTLTATASNGSDRFWITRAANGSLSRGCGPRGQGNCPASGSW